MNRRQMLKLGSAAGALGGVGLLTRQFLLPPRPSRRLDSVDELARRLFAGLDSHARDRACVAYDHPLRQYHNRGVRGGGLAMDARAFDRTQRSILTDLFHAGLSAAGRERVPDQFFVNWPGIHVMNVLICGDPSAPPYQIVLSGPHVNLRLGGACPEGAAFGGPQVYGDQRGDERQGLPGNVYRYQFEIAQRLFQSLGPEQRRAALLARTPIQTQIELQGREGAFDGVPLAALSPGSKVVARELVDGILSTYPPQDVQYAQRCLTRNGGLEALYLAYYEEGEVGGSGEYQIFRLEGPAAVFYFRGYPHVHAFVNVAMDGDRPLSVGEPLGENPVVLEGAAVKRLFEDAMRHQTDSDFAHYDEGAVAGRLRRGTIRTGDVYCLESWQDEVAVVAVAGANLRPRFVEELRRRGDALDPRRLYTVATTGYVARNEATEKLGKPESRRKDVLLRDAVIDYLKARGFSRRG